MVAGDSHTILAVYLCTDPIAPNSSLSKFKSRELHNVVTLYFLGLSSRSGT
jgi:hypothetical protein